MWARGRVCLDLMSLTSPHGDETAGAALNKCWLGRYLVSLALRLMAKLSPHDPEMWLDLEPIPHRCYAHLAADRQIPRGFSTVLPR